MRQFPHLTHTPKSYQKQSGWATGHISTICALSALFVGESQLSLAVYDKDNFGIHTENGRDKRNLIESLRRLWVLLDLWQTWGAVNLNDKRLTPKFAYSPPTDPGYSSIIPPKYVTERIDSFHAEGDFGTDTPSGLNFADLGVWYPPWPFFALSAAPGIHSPEPEAPEWELCLIHCFPISSQV